MKTAAEYLRAQLAGEPTAFVSYATALASVQAALDEAATIRAQVAQGIADYFGDIMPLPELPADTPSIRLGEKFFQSQPCYRCGRQRDACGCEQPPF